MHENTVASPRKGEIIICMTRPMLSHEHSVSVSSFRINESVILLLYQQVIPITP
ncbi:hypothetical protein ECSTECS1191_1594 [Escherichia coli STEC_S1191]|nr:hypothetical protein ECSTECS1191_1594 [Escherichia coli STEC_S1191]